MLLLVFQIKAWAYCIGRNHSLWCKWCLHAVCILNITIHNYGLESDICYLYIINLLSGILLDLIQATKASNHAVTNVQVLKYLFDIREWISPHLDQIRYHTEPHIFRFAKNHKDQSVMFYKAWSHDNWEPSNDGLILLKVPNYYVCAWNTYEYIIINTC